MKAYSEWGADKIVIDKIEPTHYVRNFLVINTIKRCSNKHKIKNICEIGCGTGSLSVELGKLGFKVDAVDIDKRAIELARRFNKNKNVNYIFNDILNLKSEKRYGMVIAIEVLEHIKDDYKALLRIKELLKENGLMLITAPIHEKYRKEFDNRSGHIRRYNTDELLNKVKTAGFKIIYTRYFNFPFLWLWYFYVYLPYSDKKEREILVSKSKEKRLPKYINILKIINKFFLIDLLFNSREYSTDMIIIAKKL